MSFPFYAEYKDSGFEWLGGIPVHWETLTLGRVTLSKCDGPFGSGLKSEHYTDFGVRVIRLQNIKSVGFDGSDATFVDVDYYRDELGDHDVTGGDVLIAGLGDDRNLVGRSCVAPENIAPAMVKADCFRFRLDTTRAFPAFVSAQLSAGAAYDAGTLSTGSTRSRIPLSIMAGRTVALPPIQEQKVIIGFLDLETAKIDTLITEQQRLIGLLKEKRQAVISHAVTKGLDPDAPMKDSGVEWLGEVPKQWAVVRIKAVVRSIEQGWSPQCESFPAESPEQWAVLKVGCVNGGYFRPSENKALPDELAPLPELGIAEGDVLVSRANTRDLVGSAAVAKENYPNLILCDKLYRLRTERDLCLPQYLVFFLGSSIARGQIELAASGASDSMLNIGQGTIRELPIALPSILEQGKILAFVNSEMAKLDALCVEAGAAITLLQERRSALISAAVTGKIDLRGIVSAEAEAA